MLSGNSAVMCLCMYISMMCMVDFSMAIRQTILSKKVDYEGIHLKTLGKRIWIIGVPAIMSVMFALGALDLEYSEDITGSATMCILCAIAVKMAFRRYAEIDQIATESLFSVTK